MLNVALHNVLVRIFGSVIIANEDSPAYYVEGLSTGKHTSDRAPTITGGEQYRVCCPFCGDRRHRLYISHAWNSELVITGLQVVVGNLAICHNENCLAEPANLEKLNRAIFSNINKEDMISIKVDSMPHVDPEDITATLPAGTRLLTDNAPEDIVRYITARGLRIKELADTWGVSYGLVNYYRDNVLVFPIYKHGRLRAWQARHPNAEQLGVHKYYWMPGTKKSWLLYNMDIAKMYPIVVVTEGVFDVFKVGPMGVALFGKKPSKHQEHLLCTLWKNKGMIWIPDMDDPGSLKAAQEFKARHDGNFQGGIDILKLPPGSDPGGMDKASLWELLVRKRPVLARLFK